jgi:hypothetical protein
VSAPDTTTGRHERGMSAGDLAVLSVGFELTGLIDGQAPIGLLAEPLDDAGTEEIVARLQEALRSARRVALLHPDWMSKDGLRRLETARAALDTHRIALVPTDLPPLAGGVLAALAGALLPYADQPGRLLGALPLASSELVVISWLRTVSSLRRPSPSMAQHARSLVAGRGFVVGLQPEEFVHRVDPKRPELPIARVERTMELVVADHGGDIDLMTDVVNPALGRLRLGQVDGSSRAEEWWGTRRLVEAVAYPTEMASLAERTAATVVLHACGWCGVGSPFDACPFCGHMVTSARGA